MEGFCLSDLMNDISDFMDKVAAERGHITSASSNADSNLRLFYERLEGLGYNLTELKPILECDDSMLILSGAGSGKTTALVLKLIRDIITGSLDKVITLPDGSTSRVRGRVLVSTFLKTGAEELSAAFTDWCKKLGITSIDKSCLVFKTIHAEVYDALKSMGVTVNMLEDSNALLKQVMQYLHIHSVMSHSNIVTADDVSNMACIVSYARNRLDDKKYDNSLMPEFALDTQTLDIILKTFKQHRQATGKMDFEDMQEVLLDGLQKYQNVRDFIANRYDYVYVDEFQDTSQLQYEILKYYFNNAKRVICIGDDDQCIYSWRGSDVDIIKNRFETDYHPVVKALTVNYRCAENILKPVIPSIEMNELRHDKDLKAAHKGGKVRVIKDNNVNLLTKYVKEDLDAGRSIGILGRTNNDLLVPAIILEIESDGNTALFNLSKGVSLENRVPKQIFGLIDLLTKRYTDGFEGLFKLFLPRRFWYEASTLASTLAINKSDSLFSLNRQDLAYSCPTLYNSVLKGVIQVQKEDPVLAYILMLNYMRDYVYTGTTVFAKKAKDLLKNVITLITEHEKVSKMNIYELDELFNQILPERFDKRKNTKNKAYIKLTTVHEAKGKEWDSVYIWNDYYGCFPNIVGNREMTKDEFEEERRVHYIAWTRAKSILTVFTSATDNLATTACHSFLDECDLSLSDSTEVTESENIINKGKTLLYRNKNVAEPTVTAEEKAELIFDDYVGSRLDDNRLTKKDVADVVIAVEDSSAIELWNRFKADNEAYDAFVTAVENEEYADVISGILQNFFAGVAYEKMTDKYTN